MASSSAQGSIKVAWTAVLSVDSRAVLAGAVTAANANPAILNGKIVTVTIAQKLPFDALGYTSRRSILLSNALQVGDIGGVFAHELAHVVYPGLTIKEIHDVLDQGDEPDYPALSRRDIQNELTFERHVLDLARAMGVEPEAKVDGIIASLEGALGIG